MRPHRSLCDRRNRRAKRDRWPFPGQHPAPFARRPPPARVSISAPVRSPSKPSRPFPAPRWFSGGGAAPHGAKVTFPKARSREVAGPSCGSRNSPLRSLRRCHVRAAASVCPSLGFSFCQTRPLTSGSESSCEDLARSLTEAGDLGYCGGRTAHPGRALAPGGLGPTRGRAPPGRPGARAWQL